MDEKYRREFDPEEAGQSASETITALARLFGPLLKITRDWPPLLAYGAVFAMLIVVLVALRTAVPAQLFWLLCAVFGGVLVAFVVTDWDARRKRSHANTQLDNAAQGRAGGAKWLLYCVSGDFASEQLEIPVDGMYIGRDPKVANLVFRSDEISSVHVRVWPEPNTVQLLVEDLNSSNGTFYCRPGAGDGSRAEWIRLQGKVVLGNGARFRLGRVAEFEIRTA